LNDDGTEMELGRGGFGVVLRGTYRMAPVAIKRLKDQSLEQQEVFMREMALLRGCRGSRYIVPFVGASLQPVRPITRVICPEWLFTCLFAVTVATPKH
jgi:serine/threonine protein kinase